MKKLVCVLVVLVGLLAIFACVSDSSSREKLGLGKPPDISADIEVFPQLGHSGSLYSVAFSPDGKFIVSGSGDGTVKLWDTATGREIRILSHPSLVTTVSGRHTIQGPNSVDSVAFSPDGMRVLSGFADKTVRLWDTASGQEIRTFSGHSGGVSSVAFSPDGTWVLSGSGDNTVKLWDTASGREIRTFSGHSNSVASVAFSLDGKQVLSGSRDKTVKLWDAASGREIRTFSGHSSEVRSVAFSPDGKQILSGSGEVFSSRDNTVKLWDAASGREIRTFLGHSNSVASVAFSPNGSQVLSGSWDNTVKLWDAASGREIRTFSGHSSEVMSVAFSPDGMRVLSGFADKTVRLWDTASGQEIRTFSFSGHTESVYSVAFSPDGKQVLSGSADKTVRLWDTASGQEIRTFSGHTESVYSVVFSPDGKQVLSGSADNTVKLWDAASGRELRTFSGYTGWVDESVAFSPDGKQVLSGSADNTVKLWDIASGREIRTFSGHSRSVHSVAFSPDGKQIISGSEDRTIKLWDAATGREIRSFSGHKSMVGSISFSPDSKTIVSGSLDRTVKLWDIATGYEIRTFSDYSYSVISVKFSSDGKMIFSGTSNNTIKFWDIATGYEIKNFSWNSDYVNSVAFNPDGTQVLSGSYDGTTRLWDASTGKEIASFIGFTDGEWIVITPEGYYNASPKGDQYLNVRIGNNVYGIDQYRHIFNRPDIVTVALSGNVAAYQAMVKKAGADIKSAVPAPKITIEPMRNAQPVKTAQIQLTVTINDDKMEIKNVWINVNGRLVAGKSVSRDIVMPASGLNVTGKDRKMYFTIPLDVEDGTNVVEVFAVNSYGAEGRADISFYAEVNQTLPNLWVLAIGVNDYRSPLMPNLAYAVNDAQELVNVFKTQEGKRYGKVNTLVIADGEKQKPTAAAIRESFAWFKQARERDLCILFIAGHAVNDQGGNYYFLPADAAFDGSGVLDPKTAISHREINAVLDMPGRKLFILDTCHSAGAGKAGIADANSFIRQAMEYYPVIFSSSRGSEVSLEKEEYRHGLFTYGIIKGIEGEAVSRSGGTVTMKSLDSYVSEIVSELSNGRQNPTTITPNGYVNFILAESEKK